MPPMGLGLDAAGMALGDNLGAGAGSFASGPPPAGYHWDFVTDNGDRVTDNGQPVVDLVAN